MRLQRIPLQHLTKYMVTPLMAFIFAGATAFLQVSKFDQLTTKDVQARTKADYLREETQIKASMALLKQLPTLGFDNLTASWAFLNFLQYFGDSKARSQTGYRVNPDFFEIIVERDPHFIDMYPYLSSSITLFAGKPQQSVALITQGLKSMTPQTDPRAYYLWRTKATDELLFLGDAQAARQSYETAADWASQSSDPHGPVSARISRKTAQFLARNPDSKQAQVGAWFNILSGAIDDQTRQLAIQGIESLGGTIHIDSSGQVDVKMPPED